MENIQSRPRIGVRRIAVAGVLSAISMILALTPSLGFIPIPPVTITTMHIPVIIAAILEGPLIGAFVGLVFGLSSMYMAATVFAGYPTIFPFLNPLVAVLPRILIGIVAYYAFVAVRKLIKNKSASIVVAAICGTLTNTIGVLGMIYILYAQRYVDAMGANTIGKGLLAVIFSGVFLNAVAEVVAASLICVPVVLAIQKLQKQS